MPLPAGLDGAVPLWKMSVAVAVVVELRYGAPGAVTMGSAASVLDSGVDELASPVVLLLKGAFCASAAPVW
jgi:hypothetical protein